MLFIALLLIVLLAVCCNCFASMQLPLLYAHGLASSPCLSPFHTLKQPHTRPSTQRSRARTATQVSTDMNTGVRKGGV
jgi:hypothetical protein